MRSDTQKVFSLAAVVVAAILFGMVISGGLNLTTPADADRPAPVPVSSPDGFVAPDFASQVAAAELGQQAPIIEVGNLDARRDFSDVRDVVRAYVLLLTKGKPGEVYNIGAGRSHSIQDLLDVLLTMSQVPIEIRQDPARMRPSDMLDIVCDATRIRELTGWQPTISFEQSLQDVLEYWRQEAAELQ